MRSVLYSAVIVSMLVAGCSDSSGPPKAGPPATLSVVTGATGEGQAGSAFPTPLAVKVSDAQGTPVPNTLVRFTIPLGGGSLSASADTTDAQGMASVTWTLGESAGAARAEARVAGVLVPAVFNATVKAGPASGMQRISNPPGQSAAGFELADSIDIRLTDRFGNPVAGTPVSFAVLNGGGSISPATGTTNESGTARAAWKLGSAGPQQLRVSAGSIETTVDATAIPCTDTQIAVGSVLTIGPNDSKCVVLSGTASRYFVTVVNAAPSAASTSAFRVRGAGAGTGTTSGALVTTAAPSFALSSAAARAQLEAAREQIETHDLIMRANERVMQQLMPQARSARAALRMQALAPPVAPPNVGDTLNLRIPGITNLCSLSGATNVRARVVFVGQHGVMLEDIAAPLAGQTDSLYQLVGAEFDTGMWTLLNTNFGNPLAMDAETDNNERFYMLFSKVVNDLQSGSIAGFVASSDFFPQNICPASNLAEVFYARVPTVEGPGNASGTAGDWYRRTRTVMMHEVKHIVSFAERFSNDAFVPTSAFNDADRWLEESSAMLAEELWARSIFGYQNKANVTYRESIHCEVRLNEANYPECPQPYKPVSMFDHFILLYEYQQSIEARSPIGASATGDFSFYGSGWSFLRWVIDTYGASESSFLTATTREVMLPGVQNIEARTGRNFADLVNDWAIATVMDDYPNFTPANARHALVSWNSRDIFAGMNRDFSSQGFFLSPVPLRPRPASFGKFAVDVSSVRGGSMAVFEVTGTQTDRQMFEFNGIAGTTFPADMRVNIIRVQ